MSATQDGSSRNCGAKIINLGRYERARQCVYPPCYKVRPLTHQFEILEKFFGVDCTQARLRALNLPRPPRLSCDGWFAIPKWKAIAGTYAEAAIKVLGELSSLHNLVNMLEDVLDGDEVRRTLRTIRALHFTEYKQRGDVIIVPVQTGARFAGQHSLCAHHKLISNEYGLGLYEVGTLLLTHPERLEDGDYLWLDCLGDATAREYAQGGGTDRFIDVPCFYAKGKTMYLNGKWMGFESPTNGPVSAFVL